MLWDLVLFLVLTTAVDRVSQYGPQGPPGVTGEVQGGPLQQNLL